MLGTGCIRCRGELRGQRERDLSTCTICQGIYLATAPLRPLPEIEHPMVGRNVLIAARVTKVSLDPEGGEQVTAKIEGSPAHGALIYVNSVPMSQVRLAGEPAA